MSAAAAFHEIGRTSPLLLPFCVLIYGLASKESLTRSLAFYYVVTALVSDIIVCGVLKRAAKVLYGVFGDAQGCIPVFGRGARPPGAATKNCGVFPTALFEHTPLNALKGSNSYGMPSGHTASVFFFATFWTMLCWSHRSQRRPRPRFDWNVVALGAVLFLASIGVGYTRIVGQYHTLQHVIVGAFVGIATGAGAFYLWNRVVRPRIDIDRRQ